MKHHPGWETSNTKYREGLTDFIKILFITAEPNAMIHSSSARGLQAGSWPCLQTSVSFFKSPRTRFSSSRGALCPTICRALLYGAGLMCDVGFCGKKWHFHMGAQLAETPAHEYLTADREKRRRRLNRLLVSVCRMKSFCFFFFP